MRIGFDGKKAVSNLTGIGNYSRGIINLTALVGNEAIVYAPKEGTPRCMAGLAESPLITFRYSDCHNALTREWWRNAGICRDISRDGLDIFHGLSNELPRGIAKTGVKSVVTIHDLIFLRLPHTYPFADRQILRLKTLHACREADRIIAISRRTRDDIVELYGIDPAKISIIYQGCHELFYSRASDELRREVTELYSLPERYLISVGTIEERKNHRAIIEALALAGSDLPVVIVSKPTPLQQRLQQLVTQLGLDSRVKFLNSVPLAHLPALYQMSTAALYVSRYEGFGIPVIEAIASGVPVVAATGSCLEEAGGEGAIYCAPDDTRAIAEAIDRLASSPSLRASLVDKGRLHIRRFSAEELAAQMDAFYHSLLES